MLSIADAAEIVELFNYEEGKYFISEDTRTLYVRAKTEIVVLTGPENWNAVDVDAVEMIVHSVSGR